MAGRLLCLMALAAGAAGCGGGSPRTHSPAPRLPRALAERWAGEADSIATAAASHDGCLAQRLVRQLSDQVNAVEAQVPVRLRAPLLAGVSSLAARITCTPQPPQHGPPPKPPKPKPKPPGHGHGHDHGHGGGDQGNQG